MSRAGRPAPGVAVTVLPSTDLFLMGRHMEHDVMRGVTPIHRMIEHGVNCALSSNNVLNPFTPFGDCSLIRMANLYANVCHVGKRDDVVECFNMVTERAARLARIENYGVAVGNDADLVIHGCEDPAAAVAELVPPLAGIQAGPAHVHPGAGGPAPAGRDSLRLDPLDGRERRGAKRPGSAGFQPP